MKDEEEKSLMTSEVIIQRPHNPNLLCAVDDFRFLFFQGLPRN